MHALPTDPTTPLSPADLKEIDRQVAALTAKIANASGTDKARLTAEKVALVQRKAAAQEDVSR